jgi:hypothetical protein
MPTPSSDTTPVFPTLQTDGLVVDQVMVNPEVADAARGTDGSPYIVPLGAPVIVTICERPGAVGNGADVAGGEEDPTTLLATTWTVYVLP